MVKACKAHNLVCCSCWAFNVKQHHKLQAHEKLRVYKHFSGAQSYKLGCAHALRCQVIAHQKALIVLGAASFLITLHKHGEIPLP